MRAIPLLLLLSIRSSAQSTNAEAAVRQTYQQGEAALQQGELAKAEKSFLQILTLVPRDVGARVNLGVVYMRGQQWARALEYLKQAERLAPQVTGIRLNIGLVYYRQGDYASAIPVFDSVLRAQPDSAQARRLLGLCYLFEERYAQAVNTLEPLWDLSNSDMSYLYSLAVAAGRGGKPELEQRALGKLLEVGQDSPIVHLLLGKAYLAHADFDHAFAELQTAARANPKLPLLHYNLGMVYRHNGDTEKAQAEFMQDAAVEPNVAFNYDQLGLLASEAGKDHQAESYFAEAVKRDRRLGTSWFGLAKIYKQQKRYPAALKALDEAAAIDPKSASVHYLRAQILTAQGRGNEAQAELATVQKLKKENVDKLEEQVSGSTYRDPERPEP